MIVSLIVESQHRLTINLLPPVEYRDDLLLCLTRDYRLLDLLCSIILLLFLISTDRNNDDALHCRKCKRGALLSRHRIWRQLYSDKSQEINSRKSGFRFSEMLQVQGSCKDPVSRVFMLVSLCLMPSRAACGRNHPASMQALYF